MVFGWFVKILGETEVCWMFREFVWRWWKMMYQPLNLETLHFTFLTRMTYTFQDRWNKIKFHDHLFRCEDVLLSFLRTGHQTTISIHDWLITWAARDSLSRMGHNSDADVFCFDLAHFALEVPGSEGIHLTGGTENKTKRVRGWYKGGGC